MWILIADGLLQILDTAGRFSQEFADDFSVLVIGTDLSTVRSIMQSAIHSLEGWCNGAWTHSQSKKY